MAAASYSAQGSCWKPTEVEIAIDVFVLEEGHATGGVRRAPRIKRSSSGSAVKVCKGETPLSGLEED